MTESLTERLAAGGGPFVIVAHSQGTMIAYEVLRQLKKADSTCGCSSRWALRSACRRCRTSSAPGPASGRQSCRPACVTRWVNVAERLDPVALDNDLSNDFDGVENKRKFFLNPDSPWHPHSATGYLQTRWVQDAVRETVSNAFAQAVGKMVITSDLVRQLEDGAPRRPAQDPHRAARPRSAAASRRRPDRDGARTSSPRSKRWQRSAPAARSQVERMRRFVSADLTRQEVERLRTLFTTSTSSASGATCRSAR